MTHIQTTPTALIPNTRSARGGLRDRARGCLMGQLAGDSLGSLVEFMGPKEILRRYPEGVRDLADGGAWNTLAGQPTDDSEMALDLARTLIHREHYDPEAQLTAYRAWMDSDPFDIGITTRAGLAGRHNTTSQANGALMRISPLGIFGVRHDLQKTAQWARQDAALTHPHPVCLHVNALFAMAITQAVAGGQNGQSLYQAIHAWAEAASAPEPVLTTITMAAEAPPSNYTDQQGWVLIAFQNALWQLLHAPSLEQGIIDTVMRGGDTDTNAAICGALLGAVYGIQAVPARWSGAILACRPVSGQLNVHRPRPSRYWPIDALELADQLAGLHT